MTRVKLSTKRHSEVRLNLHIICFLALSQEEKHKVSLNLHITCFLSLSNTRRKAYSEFESAHHLFLITLQTAPVSSWTAGQQVLVGSWQQIPGLTATTQRPVPQPILQESLAPQPAVFADNWRQSIVLDGLDQTPLGQLVCCFFL